MDNRLSIVEEILRGGYDTSVITTYNAYLPFYEQVVLPALLTSGSRHNIVLMDARECGRALARASTRPQLAGREYALLPIRSSCAFHPKLILLLGKKRGCVLVGSHNLTVSGFGHNREITNRFEIVPEEGEGQNIARQAWGLLKLWTQEMPAAAREAIEALAGFAGWLQGPIEQDEAVALLGTEPDGQTLWQRLQPLIPGPVRRAVSLGPFFDESLRFLRALVADLAPDRLFVGVDPATVLLSPRAASLVPTARFVDASPLAEKHGYLHAKALWLDCGKAGQVLVTGSANPSHPAWLGKPGERNIEAVVVRRTKDASLAKALGLDELLDAPALGKSAWAQLAERASLVASVDESTHAAVLAIETDVGFDVDSSALAERPVSRATLLSASGADLGPAKLNAKQTGHMKLHVLDAATRSATATIVLDHGHGMTTYAIAYHAADLQARAQTETQKVLRRVMFTLDTQMPQLEELLVLMEKVIFSRNTEQLLESQARRGDSPSDQNGDREAPASLEISLHDMEPSRRRRRYAVSSNLALLLDALIHRLGLGLGPDADGLVKMRAAEEALAERDSTDLAPVDGNALAQLCRRKIATLLRRMADRLERLADEQGPLVSVFQLAAVLGVAKLVCSLEQTAAWVPPGEGLADASDAENFVWRVAGLTAFPQTGILIKAAGEALHATHEEVSICRGLLLWLAFRAGLDMRPTETHDRDDLREATLAIADLMLVAAQVAEDPVAEAHARDAMGRTCDPRDLERGQQWLSRHIKAGTRLASLIANHTRMPRARRSARVGDLAVPTKDRAAPPMFVVEVRPGVVILADPNSEEGVRKLGEDYVSVIDTDKLHGTDEPARRSRQ